MCGRLRYLIQDILGLSDQVAASKMGYSNATTLWRVWHGKTFPDSEKLFRLAEIHTSCGRSPSLHWVITGKGNPLLSGPSNSADASPRALLQEQINHLPIKKVEFLIGFLAD